MSKKILPIILAGAFCFTTFFSCKKTTVATGDQTVNYFPISLGKYVTYDVDSVVYIGDTLCNQYETRTQLKYAIDDTFRDNLNRLSYIMDVFSRQDDGGKWVAIRTILLTQGIIPPLVLPAPAGVPTSNILYSQDGTQYEKLVFPIVNGQSWPGNQFVSSVDPSLQYLQNWTYSYQDLGKPYNNGYNNYQNTVTVLEDNESVNYPQIDSALTAYRIYEKEIYAYNVGMVYKEFTHWTYQPYNAKCVNGFTVVMRATDHN